MLTFAKGIEIDGRDDFLEAWARGRVDLLRAEFQPASEWHYADTEEPARQFDLVLAVDEQEVARCTFDEPYATMARLGRASRFVAPGGHLVWSYLHAFSDEEVANLLEPAAIHRNLVLRGMTSMTAEPPPSRIEIYNHPDTLFLHHRVTLQSGTRHIRIVRILGCLRR